MSNAMGGPVAAFADHDQMRTSPGPIGRPRVERYAWKEAFDVPLGVSTKLPLFETVPLPAPWAETVGANRAAQTRINSRLAAPRINPLRSGRCERSR